MSGFLISCASPLVIAAHSGHNAFGRYLLDAGADPNSDDAGYTALHAAILRGDERLVETLLQHGADPNSRLLAGTPLRRASQDWSLNPALTSATPYWLAAYYREPAIMRDLVAAGAWLCGPPEHIAEKLAAIQAQLPGLARVTIGAGALGIPPSAIKRNIEWFGREVLPKFQEIP